MQTEALNKRRQLRRRLSAIPILIVSVAFVSICWMGAMIDSDNLISELSKASTTVRSFADNTFVLVGAGFLLSLIGVSISSIMLIRAPHIFLALWVYLMSITDAKIPGLQQLSFALRYPMMLSLLFIGLYSLWNNLGKLNLIQKLGLLILLGCFLQLVINPFDTSTLLMLPMQIAMFIGTLCGLPQLIKTPESSRKLAYSLAVAGIFCTMTNYLSFIFVPRVFIAGRFTSWYPLPTGFSNNFVLCLTPIMWAFLDTRRFVLKLLFGAFFFAGLALIILSGTRNALLALAMAAVIFTVFWKRHLFIYVAILGTLAILGALVFNFGLSDLGQAGLRIGNVSSKEVRYTVWAHAWSFIIENPIWGYGLSRGLENLDKTSESWELFNAHNAYLGLWLRLGIFGALAYIIIYANSFIAGFGALLKQKSSQMENAMLVLFVCIASELFVAGFFEENLSSRASIFQTLWAISIAMIFIEIKRLKQQRSDRIRKMQSLVGNIATSTQNIATPFANIAYKERV